MKNHKITVFSKRYKVVLAVTGFLTVAVCLIMNIFIIPMIESTTQGIRCFDMMSFGYSYETAEKFLCLISDASLKTYLTVQLPLDFVYMAVYSVFFIMLIKLLKKRNTFLFLFPVLLVAADIAEDIAVTVMLKCDTLSQTVVSVASTATVVKSFVMYFCFILIAVLLIKSIIANRKNIRKGE